MYTDRNREQGQGERERANKAGNLSGGDVNGQEGKVVQRASMQHLRLGRAENHRQQSQLSTFCFLILQIPSERSFTLDRDS